MSNETTTTQPETAPAIREPKTVKDFLALPAYKARFEEVLGKRANQFMASVVSASSSPALSKADPRSVIASAMVAATLDLPVNPTLGMAYIVAYGNVAQFQIGYKGIIQLGLRSGQYRRMNAGPVNEGVFVRYDSIGEPVLDWSKYNPLAPAVGYFAGWELVNGFTKTVYWTKAQCMEHGARFSKSFRVSSSPWKTDPDAMCTKTVITAGLKKWGILSVEMQKAAIHDQGAQRDIDAEVEYVDIESAAAAPARDEPLNPFTSTEGDK